MGKWSNEEERSEKQYPSDNEVKPKAINSHNGIPGGGDIRRRVKVGGGYLKTIKIGGVPKKKKRWVPKKADR